MARPNYNHFPHNLLKMTPEVRLELTKERIIEWTATATPEQLEKAYTILKAGQYEEIQLAFGCPKDEPLLTWLIEIGILQETDGNFELTPEAKALRP
jgi:hypothetical protein